jgi:alpha-L-arabinofuranosidase
MGEYVQDALDAIEYANGDVNTTWGAKRAAAGHPEPFNMKYIEIGNENGGADYDARYTLFYDAIKAAYPEMNVIANVWGGTPWSRPFDLMDEHYYTDPATMLSWATKYDSYSRSGPKVFVGEYAVVSNRGTYGNLTAAIAEAAFMTGMERNCDVVKMAAYAPLFCRLGVNIWEWLPDAIYFDNTRWFGTPGYHVQKMFANHMGTALLPMTQNFRSGSIGLSTWNTQAEFRNITVTDTNSQVLYQSGFESGATGWVANSGTWGVNTEPTPDSYRQTANGNDYRATYTGAGSASWKDYTLSLQARKNSGSEGFLIMFHVADSNNWAWWNLGGWNNTTHAIEYSVNGTKITGPQVSGSINTNQWYNIRITVQGNTVNCYLDDVLTQSFTFPASSTPIHSVASMDENTREIILKSVNPNGSPYAVNLVLNGASAIGPETEITTLTSANPADENTMDAPHNVVPVTGAVSTPSPSFTVNLPAYSVNILRVQTPALAPPNLSVTPGNQQTQVTWDATAGATSYTLKRATTSGGPYSVVASGLTVTQFTDSSLENGTTYYYMLTADNSAGTTSATTEASGTPVSPPIGESELIAPDVVTTESEATITVNNSIPGRSYTLQYSEDLQPDHWQDLGSPKIGTGGEVIFTDQHSGAPRRFYRVKLR